MLGCGVWDKFDLLLQLELYIVIDVMGHSCTHFYSAGGLHGHGTLKEVMH